eukprot:14347210-Ditylum_brightwellii.AAC.1
MPKYIAEDVAMHAALNLIDAIQKPPPMAPSHNFGSTRWEALYQLADIFQQHLTPSPVTKPPPMVPPVAPLRVPLAAPPRVPPAAPPRVLPATPLRVPEKQSPYVPVHEQPAPKYMPWDQPAAPSMVPVNNTPQIDMPDSWSTPHPTEPIIYP